ncbi:MAG TPA: DUF58 domain-containing protein [Vicinamibacterales bacterium]|nr:DUF58 domain-containing protein [Vicinamibacterales bacterium]
MTRALPGRTMLSGLAALAATALLALVAGATAPAVSRVTLAAAALLAAVAAVDLVLTLRGWRAASPMLTRDLPAAFAIGVKRPIRVAIEAQGTATWRGDLHDHADATLAVEGLPIRRLAIQGGKRVDVTYTVTPTMRGDVTFAPADVRIRSRWGFWEVQQRLGPAERRRVFPDFAQVARYAWLAGDRRLQEIGVKTYQLRGQGTDFKQLSEYRLGDDVRHIDWRATLRANKPIVREFQDERDQCVMLLVDCGRRMRADDRTASAGTAHFDQVLNAVMLLSYVALGQGDAVGAMTFGTPPGGERSFPPRKGKHALNALMGQMYDVQPTATHSDYLAAARALLLRQRKRALVIVITNFRDEDSTELAAALRLLRHRHLVLLASLRERVVGEMIRQPFEHADPIDIAAAHLYEQARRNAFNRLAANDALMADAEPEWLGVELVNRYHAVKRAGLI